jgi:hypothetical protein
MLYFSSFFVLISSRVFFKVLCDFFSYINQNNFEGLKNNNTKPFWKYIKLKQQDAGGIAPLKKGANLFGTFLENTIWYSIWSRSCVRVDLSQ